eukprot:scaffold4869_cov183-Amphora_coffeaeformis.AAC.9
MVYARENISSLVLAFCTAGSETGLIQTSSVSLPRTHFAIWSVVEYIALLPVIQESIDFL